MDTITEYAILTRNVRPVSSEIIALVFAKIIDALISPGSAAHRGPNADRIEADHDGHPVMDASGLQLVLFGDFESRLTTVGRFGLSAAH